MIQAINTQDFQQSPDKYQIMEVLGDVGGGIGRLKQKMSLERVFYTTLTKKVSGMLDKLEPYREKIIQTNNVEGLEVFMEEVEPLISLTEVLKKDFSEMGQTVFSSKVEKQFYNTLMQAMNELLLQYELCQNRHKELTLDHCRQLSEPILHSVWTGPENDEFDQFYADNVQTG